MYIYVVVVVVVVVVVDITYDIYIYMYTHYINIYTNNIHIIIHLSFSFFGGGLVVTQRVCTFTYLTWLPGVCSGGGQVILQRL